MPHVTVTCPHCDATLRPAKPVAEGKSVKCPKCSETFVTPEASGSRQPAKAVGKAAAKTAAPKAAAPKPPPPKKPFDDDDDGGTYGVIKDPEEEARRLAEEERQRRKRKKRDEEDEDDEEEDDDDPNDVVNQYLKNLKTKDPRGPAQEKVVKPSNYLLMSALAGFFGWVITLIVFMIPVAFPNIERKEDLDRFGRPIQDDEYKKKNSEDRKPPVFELQMILKSTSYVVAFVASLVLGVIHAALIAIGAVKMFNLESYRWAITSSILTIIPIHLVPLWYFIWTPLDWILDDIAPLAAAGIFIFGPIVGAVCLVVLKKPEVQEGYSYHPD